MKRVLIISPYFPPSNTPDMQRIRTSLPYFKDFDWEAQVVAVKPQHTDLQKDHLLTATLPDDIKIHWVDALSKKWTAKLGFGNLAYRSYYFYKKFVNALLHKEQFDLIYFSTTQFAICTLGPYWKKRFNIPYVIDMQDPWHSEYYRDKPRHQQPPKYWLSYRLNKYLEPIAMKEVDGLISVSEDYITDLKNRYPQIKAIPAATITFGSFKPDLQIALKNNDQFKPLLNPAFKNLVYAGRGGRDMYSAITPLFKALKQGLVSQPQLFKNINIYFIGTSYAPAGQAVQSILPLAQQMGVNEQVVELANRISYFHALATLQQADGLFIPGSDDPKYTASKIYPYLLTRKPLLAVFNSASSALSILKTCGAHHAYSFDNTEDLEDKILNFLIGLVNRNLKPADYDEACLEEYSAKKATEKQCRLFNQVLNQK